MIYSVPVLELVKICGQFTHFTGKKDTYCNEVQVKKPEEIVTGVGEVAGIVVYDRLKEKNRRAEKPRRFPEPLLTKYYPLSCALRSRRAPWP